MKTFYEALGVSKEFLGSSKNFSKVLGTIQEVLRSFAESFGTFRINFWKLHSKGLKFPKMF